jgi:hypothetical protein
MLAINASAAKPEVIILPLVRGMSALADCRL